MKLPILLTLLALLSSCLPEQTARLQQGTENLDSTTTDQDEDDITYSDEVAPYWLDSGQQLSTLTINYDNLKNHYIFGSAIDAYLQADSNFDGQYCLHATFLTGSNSSKPLIARATPAVTTDYRTGTRNRYLRIQLSQSSGNEICNKDILISESPLTLSSAPATSSVAFNTEDVCDNCLGIINSNSLKLYKINDSSFLEEIETSTINYSELSIRIDMNGNTTSNPSTCSDAGCKSQGYDCCIQGQCVNEAAVKQSGAQADPQGFNLAESEKDSNSNWYLKYPQYYYSCLEDPQNDDGDDPVDPEDPAAEAEERRLAMIADYDCIEELKANSNEDPFHKDPYNSSASYNKCEVSTTTDNMYYETVMKRLYGHCGCAEKDDLDLMVKNCPAYTYKLVYETDAQGNETSDVSSVECVTPATNDNDLPFQDLEVMVSSRSAPHRFFNKNNEEINPYVSGETYTSTEQEGEPFQYLDDSQLFPLNGSFNMNSILGQMNVSLDQARPAKLVDLEFDKVYYIAALDGYYTACPQCGKDSWFTNFSPYPSTQDGLGLRARGFTTSRDSWGTNSVAGNYEDTIFGRACWVPPTMLPFSHSPDSDVQQQRLNRLSAQSAMYVNGYQRDWFGFNKGALIGSFDGVTWFAIGKGRKVRATSDKLYLAINAPFADLASPTDHIVSVQEYDFMTTAANYDYDPNEEINSPFQNDGGLCQKQHECETDSHCITKLGWEYSCVDVFQYKTSWPNFEAVGASEIGQDEKSGALVQFLQQGQLPPGSSSKRCVYRGAGAPCAIDLTTLSDENKRKALSCAPNFYCAALTSSDFNKEVARFAAPLENQQETKNHYFGKDANVLGRPKDYVITSGGSTLPLDVREAIEANLGLTSSLGTSSHGLCRPAKSLPKYAGGTTTNYNPLDQHRNKDTEYRTDFISQIGGCNANLYTGLKYSSCPIIDSDGNYLHLKDSFINDQVQISDSFISGIFDKVDATKYYATQQNMCGLEAVDSNTGDLFSMTEDQIRDKSAFKSIEARTLASSDTQLQPTFAQNACFRRAGSVCHTNYDCSPNYKHYELIDILGGDMFGNVAERKYWEEYLVCSQESREPTLTTDSTDAEVEAFNSYSMHNNRCCREVGKDITMYTEDSPLSTESTGLRTDIYGGFQPNNPNRYSRYAASLPIVDDATLASAITNSRVSARRPNDPGLQAGDPTILDTNQWKNIHDAGARTCCGGSWVRKFADGTNDWSKKRLSLDVNNFKCVNYQTPLLLTETPADYNLSESDLNQDRINFCVDSGLGAAGCAQSPLGSIDSLSYAAAPSLDYTTFKMKIDTDPEKMNDQDLWAQNPWAFMQLLPYDSQEDAQFFEWNVDLPDLIENREAKRYIHTRIPSFMAFNNISEVRIDLENPYSDKGGQSLHPGGSCKRLIPSSYNCNANGWNGLCGDSVDNVQWNPSNVCSDGDQCCYMYDDSTRILKVAYSQGIIDDTVDGGPADEYEFYGHKSHSLYLEFTAPGTLLWEQTRVPATAAIDDPNYLSHRRSSKPGDALFYLEKLAKLEYIGIPQMTYEPVFCNDIYQKVVPGIFKDSIETVSDFINSPETFVDPSADTYWSVTGSPGAAYDPYQHWDPSTDLKKVADQKLLDHEPIFSDHEFKCCLPLGSPLNSTEDASICCSGAAGDGDTRKCALPDGTDLNVYFNKFVSGEGLDDQYLTSAQPLDVDDFDPATGEPKTSAEIVTKLKAIGSELCASGTTRRGGAFGPFDGEPYANFEPEDSTPTPVNGLVDSIYDAGESNNQPVGYNEFSKGYKWNHHVYCGEGN
ncbi:MAG: hypothetical protein KC478_00625 [Bacteriovoracaceae bacterium]|nr:hypothetical protein [Bacteriovoracaceae bacterium]